VFFTSFLVAIFFIDPDKIPFMGSWQFRVGYVVMYLLFGLFLYFTFIQLLRVDMGPENFHASNYIKIYAYKYKDIEKIDEQNYGLFRLITIHLRAEGSLGKKITFIPSYKNYEYFIEQHPELFEHLLQEGQK
jgi:hypothetical protein